MFINSRHIKNFDWEINETNKTVKQIYLYLKINLQETLS